jgi:uncharacterized membrane protein
MLSIAHLTLSVISLILGFLVLLNTKGAGLHRRLGALHCASTIGLNLAAFGIEHLTVISTYSTSPPFLVLPWC